MLAQVPFLAGRLVQNLRLDREWLLVELPREPGVRRYRFLLEKYAAIAANRRSVRFLGRPFVYDNRLAPALLQGYPKEILDLGSHVDLRAARTVFDVGANVGQFAFTLKRYWPHLEVCSFEPNPSVFPLLERNARGVPGWRVFPFGVGPEPARVPFFWVPGKSAQGSVHRANSVRNLQTTAVQQLSVDLRPVDGELMRAWQLPWGGGPAEGGRGGV